MAQKIKYKVISFSSEQRQYPASSLIVTGSDGWQTKRFCNYPQEVTLQFYGVVHVDKIQIMADTRKIASSVDVLYYDPTESATESRFIKYGSLEFSRNQSGRIHQQKTVMVDLKCLYLRFLFHRPYKNKQNFFSQVHIHQVAVFGGESNVMLPLQNNLIKKNQIDHRAVIEEEDQFVYEKLVQIQALKDRAVADENFDDAERLKQIMVNVKKFGYYLKGLKQKKQEAAENQDYEEAKSIKEQIDRVRREVEALVNSGLEGGDDEQMEADHPELEHDVQGNQFVGLEMNQLLDRQSQSRVSHKNSRVRKSSFMKNKNLESSYDQRVIPTLQHKIKTQQSENLPPDNQPVQLPAAQQIEGNNAADALAMQEFFQEETTKQFFSKTWQLKEKALTDISAAAKSKPQDTPLIKCLLRICAHSIKQTNFKIVLLSLSLITETIKINAAAHKVTRNTTDASRDLHQILQEIIKKMSDNNSKIKNGSEQVFQQMIDSSLYGVDVCSLALMKHKSKVKLSTKQEAQRLNALTNLINKYGLGDNGVPYSVLDYSVDKLANPAAEVRNQSINLLATCANLDEKAVFGHLQGKKPIFLQQVQAKQKQLAGGKGGGGIKSSPANKSKKR